MKNKKINKINIAIAVFLIILTVSMPISFAALRPEIRDNEIKENPFVDSFVNFLKKIISFFDIMPSVLAQGSQGVGCCEVMKNGAKCQISTLDECQSAQQWHQGQSCETICRIGCCIDAQGFCSKQAISTQCLVPPALKFIPNDPQCQQDVLCKYGCCTIGYQKIWTTNLTCSAVYKGVWDGSVPDELACIQQAYQEQRGCCRSYAGCEYITGAECQAKGGEFFSDKKCYDSIPGCEKCQGYGTPKCVEGFPDLYKTDNCGNAYTDEIKEQCSSSGKFCNPETNACESGECKNIYKNNVDGNFGPKASRESMRNGESWCIYDTPLDLMPGGAPMGSRHWRHYCLYGREYVEPCADYRQQVCAELQCVPKEGSTTSGGVCGTKTSESDCISAGCAWIPIRQAYCVTNRWRECFNITNETECNKHGSCFWWTDFQSQVDLLSQLGLMPYYDLKIEEAKDKWISFSKDKRKYDSHELPLCLPKYPPGFDDNNKAAICSLGNYFCQYKEEWWWGLDTENKECEKDEFYALIAHTCRSIGDCGLYLNYLQKPTTGLKILEVEKPQEGQDITKRVKKEIATPKSYEDFVKAMKQVEGDSDLQGPWWRVPIGTLEILGPITLIRSITPIGWGILSIPSYSGCTLVGIVGSSLVAAGIILILISLLMPIGLGRGAMQAAGTGLITAGTLALATSLSAWAITGIGVSVAVLVFLLYWWGYDERYYMIQCNPSLPPVGGEDCHVCNEDQTKPCTKYRCESLGQACMFNDTIQIGGRTFSIADAECIAAQNDGLAPWITSVEVKDLQGNRYRAQPSSTTGPTTINIDKNGDPIPDGTQLIIKIKLNEKALCMWDIESTSNISEMDFPYQSTVLRDELQQQFLVKQALPFIYVRCADAYGNANVAEYIFRFSTTVGPDLTPPVVLGTDRDYYNKFSYGMTQLPLFIYVNEMATCRWAKQDVDYNLMSSETECRTSLTSTGFKCSTTLAGLQSEPPGIANTFYIRCKDTAGNVMQQSYQLVLYSALPLFITSIVPENGAHIKSCEISGIELKVETAEGAENGKATCYWKNNSEWQRFSVTNDVVHLTNLSAISQTVSIKCVDSALNVAQNSTTFTVEKDETQPKITRIYKEGSRLVLRTDENATCAYRSLGKGCDFDATHWLQAIKFSTTNGLEHSTEWRSEPWYVKCYDSCGNGGKQQDPCIVILPSDVEFE